MSSDSPSFQERVIVAGIGLVLILVGLTGVYFFFQLDRSGPLRLAGSIGVIGLGIYMIYAAVVGKSWVGVIKPESAEERHQKFNRDR